MLIIFFLLLTVLGLRISLVHHDWWLTHQVSHGCNRRNLTFGKVGTNCKSFGDVHYFRGKCPHYGAV